MRKAASRKDRQGREASQDQKHLTTGNTGGTGKGKVKGMNHGEHGESRGKSRSPLTSILSPRGEDATSICAEQLPLLPFWGEGWDEGGRRFQAES